MHALIFDFDGVIVLSDKARFAVLKQMTSRYDLILPDQAFAQIIGRTTRYFLTEIFPDISDDKLALVTYDYEKEFKGNITKHVKPNTIVISFLHEYRGPKKLALATSSSRLVVEKVLHHFELDHTFDLLVCKEDTTKHKPDPEIYHTTAELLGVTPRNCIVIEDSIVGASSAIAAGMECAIVLGDNSPRLFAQLAVRKFIKTTSDLFDIARE